MVVLSSHASRLASPALIMPPLRLGPCRPGRPPARYGEARSSVIGKLVRGRAPPPAADP
jgi:hypothetical protein